MSNGLIRSYEPLEADELQFLYKKEERERRQLYRVARYMMIASFVIPFIVAWFRAAEGMENPFSYEAYFVGTGFLLCFSGTGLYLTYRRFLQKLQKDISAGTKTIEQTHITRKQFMPHNNTWFFYLNSPNQYSIEVNEADYNRLDEGDELNIEYTTYSKMYLGYF